ncbi:hypothetical protein QQ045_016576 [Rhodiola kirilowii]
MGTVDFIFGDAAAVFQLCMISPRKFLHGQSNTVTVQGRDVACSDKGFSFHLCVFMGAEELETTTRSFLGACSWGRKNWRQRLVVSWVGRGGTTPGRW